MRDNSKKIILDLCGGSGAWSKPYKENGYDVRLITLPGQDVKNYIPPENVYGILAAPPCTMFSLAKCDKTSKIKRNFEEGMSVVIACLDIIWKCRYKKELKFWCLENPRGYLRQFLGRPVVTFYAFHYGDLWCKATDLWGYFNIENAKYTREWFLPGVINNNRIMNSFGHCKSNIIAAAERAKTPQGFANAFFRSNR